MVLYLQSFIENKCPRIYKGFAEKEPMKFLNLF